MMNLKESELAMRMQWTIKAKEVMLKLSSVQPAFGMFGKVCDDDDDNFKEERLF